MLFVNNLPQNVKHFVIVAMGNKAVDHIESYRNNLFLLLSITDKLVVACCLCKVTISLGYPLSIVA